MKRDVIERQQNALLAADGPIFQQQCHCKGFVATIDIFKEIINYDKELVRNVLGDFGLRLRDYAFSIDGDHPHNYMAIDVDWDVSKRYSDIFCQCLKAGQFIQKEGLDLIVQPLRKAATTKLPPRLKYIDTPIKTQRYVRLLPHRKDRDKVRSTKSMRQIDLRAFYKKGRSAWDGLPDDFSQYLRFNQSYKEQIRLAQKKVDRYKSMGCEQLAKRIEEDIASFEDVFGQDYYGFHRLTMTKAAVILAKMHGFGIHQDDEFAFPCIIVPDSTFSGAFGVLNDGPLEYTPRAYPMHEMDTIPFRVQTLVDRLENLPDADGKSAFDHYIVVVPSVAYPENLDNMLIDKGVVTPILLGESDGNCHFLCYYL